MEMFTDVKGFEGLYLISNCGNVKSLPKGDGNGGRTRILKPEINARKTISYKRVTLSKEGKVYRFQVHRLVAEAFIANPDNKPFVNHIDNDGTNNHVSNLEWVTHSENMEHSSRQGRQDIVKKLGGIATGKLTREKLIEKLNVLEVNYTEIVKDALNNRTYVTFICKSCSISSKGRADNPSILKGGYCGSCLRRKLNL